MADKCQSCGEFAVIEDDIMDGGRQKICIECGTVATGLKTKIEPGVVVPVKSECVPFHDVKLEQQICELCGDTFQSSSVSGSDTKTCSECQELMTGGLCEGGPDASCENKIALESESSSKTCKSCGSRNLGMDLMGVDERLVCRDCGTVAGNEALLNDEFEVVSRSYNNSFVTLPFSALQPKKVAGKVAGREKINFLHNKFCFPNYVKEEALEMFDQVFYMKRVIYTHIVTKEHLAAACIFVVCRKHDIPVSLLHFQKYVDKFSVFLKGTKIILKCLNISLPHMSLSRQVEDLLVSRGFGSSIISKTQDILFLCRQAWLTQGRSREGLIIIAAYYAYLSSDKCSGFVSMTKFRKMFSFPTISLFLQAECNSLFLRLASSIPWVSTKNIKSNTVHKYINDILKYQNSLFQLTFKSETDSKNHLHGKLEFDCRTVQQNVGHSESCHRTKTKRGDSAQKEALLPPVLKKFRQEVPVVETHISPNIDLDSPDLKESEFDESEISSYLLSPEEEAQLRTPKLKFMRT